MIIACYSSTGWRFNDRQVIYISRNTYEEVYNIVFGIGGRKASVSSFIECILLHHFKIYEEDYTADL